MGVINESKNNLLEALKYFKKAKKSYENYQYEKTKYKKQYDEIIQAINNIQSKLDKEN